MSASGRQTGPGLASDAQRLGVGWVQDNISRDIAPPVAGNLASVDVDHYLSMRDPHPDPPAPRPPNIATPAESPQPVPAPDQPQTPDEGDQDIVAVLSLADELGIAAPEPHYEICNDETGEAITVADIAWPQGIQPGRAAQPVALLLGADPGTKASLGELGYRFFTSRQKLVWHLEELLGVDIDGDEAIGEVETETNNA